ncbi:MAG: SPOR domain-containing protein [Candidatus Symbiothrix sp.]|jgi:cell division septation protein DedD|nr:SPOR domain-containing protein [Candidatus Symbiothrix sp.]
MKSRVFVWGAVSLLLLLVACKSTPSGYKQVYDAAKPRSTVQQDTLVSSQAAATPSSSNAAAQGSFRVERLTAVDGSGIKQFSVVIGSFVNKTNAESLKNRMKAQGYNAFLAQNEKEMYRVIVATFDSKANAIAERDAFKVRYAPDFSDTWLLEQAQ